MRFAPHPFALTDVPEVRSARGSSGYAPPGRRSQPLPSSRVPPSLRGSAQLRPLRDLLRSGRDLRFCAASGDFHLSTGCEFFRLFSVPSGQAQPRAPLFLTDGLARLLQATRRRVSASRDFEVHHLTHCALRGRRSYEAN